MLGIVEFFPANFSLSDREISFLSVEVAFSFPR